MKDTELVTEHKRIAGEIASYADALVLCDKALGMLKCHPMIIVGDDVDSCDLCGDGIGMSRTSREHMALTLKVLVEERRTEILKHMEAISAALGPMREPAVCQGDNRKQFKPKRKIYGSIDPDTADL